MSEKQKEEAEMTNDQNYVVLAQIYTILNDGMSQKTIAMRKVLQNDFDINYSVSNSKCSLPNIVGRTALDFALEKSELEIFKMLLRYGADFTNKNQSDSTILHRIVEKSYQKNEECYKLKEKVEHPFANAVLSTHIELKNFTNSTNQDGISHFHIACMFNHVETVQFFLTQGVCVNKAISQDSKIFTGFTPLHLAAKYSAFETAKLLLIHNADVNLKDAQGMYPLFLLIERNNEISDIKNVIKKPLCEKLKNELAINENMIKLLLEKSKDNEEGLSRCHVVCTLQDTQMLENILTEGVNLKDSVSENSSFWPGFTALHFAALFNINAVRLLVANGADTMTKDANEVTPFDLCLQRYSLDDINSIVPELHQIMFSDGKTKLSDLILAWSSENTLKSFLQETNRDVNMSLPFDSPLWPGYTILHIAIVLSYRNHDDRDLYEDIFFYYYEGEKNIQWCLTMGANVNITNFYNSTPLHLAFELQNRSMVDSLLSYQDKLVNVFNSDNLSHFHIACAAGCTNLVKKLLRTGIDVNQPITSNLIYRLSDYEDKFLHMNAGWTCLHIAVATSKIPLAELLIKYDADLYTQDSFEMTPVHQVLCSGSRTLGYDMFSRKYYENRVTSFGLSHLHVACFIGDLEAVEQLLNQHGANMEGTINYSLIRSIASLSALAPFDGYTPVHFALREHHFEIVKMLVERGVDLLAKSTNGSTPFYEMLKTSIEEYDGYMQKRMFALEILSDKRIEKIVKEDSGITKLHIACLASKSAIAIKLLKDGADPIAQIHADSPISPGLTPLHIIMNARFTCSIEDCEDCDLHSMDTYEEIEAIGKSLLEHGASVMLKDAEGNTPIHKVPEILAYNRMGCILGWMLEGYKDFSLNPVNSSGISHFDVACMCSSNEVVENFLLQGVDVNRQFGYFSNRYGGFTPLHVAALYKNDSMVDLLLKQGASHQAKNFLGNTPMHLAALLDDSNRVQSFNRSLYERLFKIGADIEAKNLWNETPFGIILRMEWMSYGNFALQRLLLVECTCCVNVFHLETEEGFLGIALYDMYRHGPVEDENFYKAIVNNPSLNDTDEMDRTVIHNIVSVERPDEYRKADSIDNYTRLIHGFINLDFDIDQRDYKGQTALHKAVLFSNCCAIIGLLMNGADINVVDTTNKPAFFYSIDRGEQHDHICRIILEAYLLQVYKLNIAGLEISSANRNIADQISKESGLLESCNSEMQRCSKELEKLKSHVISNSYSITLYNFLCEPMHYFRMMLFLLDEIDNIFVKNVSSLRKKYPQFAGLLQMQYRNIFIRAQLIDPAKSALNFLAEFPLPDLCSERILKSLNNRDLKQLIAAAQ